MRPVPTLAARKVTPFHNERTRKQEEQSIGTGFYWQ